MGILREAFFQGSWLAGFKFFGQIISWAATILVARVLVPADYGLMTIATVFTGYAMLFSELGLGSAIIQRPSYTEDELSSVFWFCFTFSLLLGLSCFLLAYPTALVFNDDRVIPIVYAVSILFVTGGVQIVPLSLLKKNISFKKVGFIEIMGTIVSCLSMIAMAHMGAGVWTLIGGHIIRNTTKLIFVYWIAKWYPKFHFNFKEVKPYLRFGLTVAFNRSVFYVNEKSDQFFAGMAWPTGILGYYSFALQLARIPIDKLIALIFQVSFPVFSKLQEDNQKINYTYLKLLKLIATIIFPIYVGGFLLGDELVKIVLGEKWAEMSFVFRWLCLSQIMVALSALNDRIHMSKGRPHWNLYYYIILACAMAGSFYFAVDYGLNWIVLPWLVTNTILSIFWILFTIKKIKITLYDYIKNIYPQFVATIIMSAFVLFFHNISLVFMKQDVYPVLNFVFLLVIGAFSYSLFLYLLDKNLIADLRSIRRRNGVLSTACLW
jgi:O-antigen/teichoic acid export membrane protein